MRRAQTPPKVRPTGSGHERVLSAAGAARPVDPSARRVAALGARGPGDLLALQGALGNRSVNQLLDEDRAAHEVAAAGVSGAGGALPHAAPIKRSFGKYDVPELTAHTDGAADEASRALGAEGYAVGKHVAFRGTPSLHTAAHEAAHVVQQRAGVSLRGGMGEAGDAYEAEADRVADLVVQGKSAERVFAASGRSATAGSAAAAAAASQPVQRKLMHASGKVYTPGERKALIAEHPRMEDEIDDHEGLEALYIPVEHEGALTFEPVTGGADQAGAQVARGEPVASAGTQAPTAPVADAPVQRMKRKASGESLDITRLNEEQCRHYLGDGRGEVDLDEGEEEQLRKRLEVATLLGETEVARIGVTEAINFGHQAAALTMVENLRALGYHGAIEIVCDTDVMAKLETMAPGSTRGALDAVTFIETGAFRPESARRKGVIGLVAADDDAADRLDRLGVDSLLTLQPYEWHARRKVFQRLHRDGRAQTREKELSTTDGELYVFDVPPPQENLDAFLDARLTGGSAAKAPGLKEVLGAVKAREIDLMAVYGVHRLADPESATANLLGGVHEAALGKPAIVLVLAEGTPEMAHTHPRIHAAGIGEIASVRREAGSVWLVSCGALPQDVFRLVCQMSTLPVVLEGANLANLMLMLGKPYLTVSSSQTKPPEGAGAEQLLEVERAVNTPVPWATRRAEAARLAEDAMKIGRAMSFPSVQREATAVLDACLAPLEGRPGGDLEGLLAALTSKVLEQVNAVAIVKQVFAGDGEASIIRDNDWTWAERTLGVLGAAVTALAAALAGMARTLAPGEAAKGARELRAEALVEAAEPEQLGWVAPDLELRRRQEKHFRRTVGSMMELDRGARIGAGADAQAFDRAERTHDPAAAATIATFIGDTRRDGSRTQRYFKASAGDARRPERNQLMQGLSAMAQARREAAQEESRPLSLAERIGFALADGHPARALEWIAAATSEDIVALPDASVVTVVRAVVTAEEVWALLVVRSEAGEPVPAAILAAVAERVTLVETGWDIAAHVELATRYALWRRFAKDPRLQTLLTWALRASDDLAFELISAALDGGAAPDSLRHACEEAKRASGKPGFSAPRLPPPVVAPSVGPAPIVPAQETDEDFGSFDGDLSLF